MIVSVHQPQYLPWLGYFDKIKKSDCFVFLDNVQYKEREFQNRNKIRINDAKNGWMWLTVPVVSKGLRGQLMRQVRIDNELGWQKEHWKSIRVWYAKARFFEEYASFFEDIYTQRKWDKLIDLNVYIIKYLLKKLGIETRLCLESEIGTTRVSTARIVEICLKLKADTYLSGSGGRDYLEEGQFSGQKIKLLYQDYPHPCYKQCFDPFVACMSIIDLLLNHGRAAKKILCNA